MGRVAFFAVVLGVMAATVGGIPVGAATTVDPCGLLTHAEVVATTGQRFELPSVDPTPDADADAACSFVRPDAELVVSVTGMSSPKAARGAVKDSKYGLSNSSGATGARKVKGIGDAALYVFDKPYAGDYLVFSDGATFVALSLTNSDRKPRGRATMTTLANSAAVRLG